jgi:hypothetical protein
MANTNIDLVNAIRSFGILDAAAAVVAIGTVAAALSAKRPFEKKISTLPLVFPRDLDKFSLSMSFDFHEYKRRSIFDQPYMKKAGTIRLPVAKSIQDRFAATWGADKAEPVTGAIIESVLESTQQNSSATIGSVLAGIGSGVAAGVQGGALSKLKSDTIPKINNTLNIATGGIGADLKLEQVLQPLGLAINPFLTVMFKEPTFKTHEFSWNLLAKDPEESRIITSIVNEFKWHMLPDIATNSSGTLLNYPSMVQVAFYSNDDFLYRFKPCAITDFSINYAPASTPSFFKGSQNVPTEVKISLKLMEIEYWTKLDFQKDMVAGTSMMPRK